jgi:hypothetical protein
MAVWLAAAWPWSEDGRAAPRAAGVGVADVRMWHRVLAGMVCVGAMVAPALAAAAVPTLNFTVGQNGQSVPSPAPMTALKAIYTEVLSYHGQSLGPLNNPQDVYMDPQNNLWIVDTGNNRVIELAPDRNAQGVPQYDQVKLVIGWPNAKGPYVLNGPEGVAVGPDGIIYIADTGNDRVAAFAPNGVFLQNLNTSSSLTLNQESVKFVPSKVAVDQDGTIYVVIPGQTFGLAEFNSDGLFEGFFAPNQLSIVDDLRYKIGQLLQTQAQKKQQASVLLPEVSDAYVGPDGYIYTTSVSVTSKQIRRLNVVGTDTLNTTAIQYGLPLSSIPPAVFRSIIQNQQNQMTASGGSGSVTPTSLEPRFVSVGVDDAGIITALDQLTDFVFQYGSEGQLLYTFGGIDNGNGVLGLFEDPTAVAVTTDGYVAVSDALEENVTLFKPTTFALLAQQGVEDYAKGEYRQAEQPWSQVLAMDANYDLAHAQLGEGYLSQGQLLGSSPADYGAELTDFSKALQQFYLANDKKDYGVAFSWYRHIWMRVNFTWIFLAFLATWLVVYLLVKLLGPRLRQHPIEFQGAWVRNQFVRTVPMAWRVIKHPSEAFFQLKYEGQGTMWQGVALIVLAYLVHLGNLVWTAFDFSSIERGQTSLFSNSAEFLLPLATWIVANYLVGDLYEGEANLAEVLTGSAYAMLPFIILQLPLALLSHVLVPSDGILHLIQLFQRLWVLYLFFTQVRVLHNLEWGQAFKASIVTLLGIGVIWTMFLVVTGLGQQAYSFVHQIIQEILLLRS